MERDYSLSAVVNQAGQVQSSPERDELSALEVNAWHMFTAAEPVADLDLPVRRLRILVAGVSLSNCSIINSCLQTTEYRIEEAIDAADVVNRLNLGSCDLALLEAAGQSIEDHHTVHAMREAEAQRRLSRVPVIALVPSNPGLDRYRIVRAGYDDYVTMPISRPSLLSAIRAWTSPVDRASIEELCTLDIPGEPSLLGILISQFLVDLDSRLQSIRAAMAEGDARNLQLAAHTLRGSCCHFGAHRMARLCTRLERDSSEMNAEVVADLEIETRHVRHILSAILHRLVRSENSNPDAPQEDVSK